MNKLLLTMAIWAATATDAQAYLDPATGSVIFQAFFGALLLVGAFWRNMKGAVKKFIKKPKDSDV